MVPSAGGGADKESLEMEVESMLGGVPKLSTISTSEPTIRVSVLLRVALGLLVLGVLVVGPMAYSNSQVELGEMKAVTERQKVELGRGSWSMPWNKPDFPVVWTGSRSQGVYTRKNEGTLKFDLIGDVAGNDWEKTIHLDGNKTMVVVMDLTANTVGPPPYIESTLAIAIGIKHMQAHGSRVLGAVSGCMDSYSSTQAFKNGQEALEFCRREGLPILEKTSDAASSEFRRWYYAVQTNAKDSRKLCSKDTTDLECKQWNTDLIVDGLNRTAQIGTATGAAHYMDLDAAGYQSVLCPQDDGLKCYKVPQCEAQCVRKLVTALEENGQCWCWNGNPGMRRQQEAIDQAFDQSRDVYTEDFATAHCFAQKHGIRNIIMIGGDALQCLLGRPVGVYEWIRQGYQVYVMQDLLLNTRGCHDYGSGMQCPTENYGQVLNSYVYGVYAGVGAQMIRMPDSSPIAKEKAVCNSCVA